LNDRLNRRAASLYAPVGEALQDGIDDFALSFRRHAAGNTNLMHIHGNFFSE